MASPPPQQTRRRSLSFMWKIGFKRTRTQSLSTTKASDIVKNNNAGVYYTGKENYDGDDLGSNWRRPVKLYKRKGEAKKDDSLTQESPQEQKDVIEKDSEYYIEDGDVVFLVQNTLFRVHKYFLTRESPVFKDMLSLSPPSGSDAEGTSDALPITLPGITSDDFANFLWIFYNPLLTEYDASIEVWIDIMRLAHMWECKTIRDLAFRELSKLPIPELERVLIGRDYEVPQAWMDKAMEALADRPKFLTEEEGRSLGVSLAVKIMALREKRRVDARHGRWSHSPSPPSSRSRSPGPAVPI